MTEFQEEFAPECPRCSEPMVPVVTQGLLGFQKCMVPAFRCVCDKDMNYPITSEDEFQSWVAMVVLGDAPQVLTLDSGEVVIEPGKRVGIGVPVCRDCEAILQEGGNPYDDGWFCSRCGTYDRDPMTRADVAGFATITSKHVGAWPTKPPEGTDGD